MNAADLNALYVTNLLFKTFEFFANLFVLFVAVVLVILFVAQTSFAPLNLKTLVHFSFEHTIDAVQPYKAYFPAPVVVVTPDADAKNQS